MTGRGWARRLAWGGSCAVLAWSAPALCGEEILYQPAPDWIAEATMPEGASGPPVVLFDDQRRLEEGRLLSYVDRAIRIDNPQMLTAAGTVQASWIADKGDLMVHRVSIIREGEEIDLLAGGARFEVLRRERQLEQRTLDGVYTATLTVPGLRVGDILRMSFTTTQADQALEKEVQAIAALPSAPFQAGFARVRMSWPEGSDVRWQASGGVELPTPSIAGGFATIEVPLPLPKQPEMPGDAPVRYQMPPLLQAGTFADWQEVSRAMAPLFGTEGTIPADSPIARQVTAITGAHPEALQRAVAALRLVQDEIAYLANGMNGGNYIPQSPVDTWDRRYGDCKAKTMLLLAMLRAMDIEAEAVVVASETGDALPTMLPMPGAFDHVIVRAVIEGTEYWLDGTSSGASMAMVAEVPRFHHALPLRDGGAGLIPVTQRPQVAFDSESTLTFDHRAGLDVPMLVSAEWHLNGSLAAPVRAIIGQATDDQMDEFIHAFAAEQLGDGLFVDGAITFDEEANSATVAVRGLLDSPWEWERGRGTRGFGLPSDNFEFRPDRARAAWRDIPVAIPGPFAERMEMTVLLPEDSTTEYRLEGRDAFSEDIAGMRLSRAARLEEGRLLLTDSAAWPGGELSPADAAAARSRAIRFGSTELTLRAPANSPRRFAAASATDRTRFAAIEEVYAEVIADNPDDVANYRYRAAFRADTYDREGALADYNIVIDREPDAAAYLQRSFLHADLDRLEESLADAEAAWELDPSLRAVQQRAELLRYFDREEEAIALLEEQNASAEERDGLILAISDLEAETGRKAEGLQRLEELLAQRPGEPMLLNARCWYQATWNYRPEDLATICTEAVESSEGSPAVLDSRAMAYFRLGRYQDALKDLDAALAVNPDQTASLLLRGVVRREMGDSGGEGEIAEALARGPSLKRYFALFGITTL